MESCASKFCDYRSEGGCLAVNEFYKKGDLVIVGIIPNNGSHVIDFRPGKVIFSGKYFCTVEVTTKGLSDDGKREPMKVRYTFDANDIVHGLIRRAKYDWNSSVIPVRGANPMILNSFIREGGSVTRETLSAILAAQSGGA